MSAPEVPELQLQLPLEVHQTPSARGMPPSKLKGFRNVRGLPLHQRKLFRNLARQTPRVQGLTFDHNQIRWISYWKNEQNKQVQKHFPVSRYGFFGARKLALEERNRVQGWPLDTDEAASAIERLKLDVAAFEGREEGAGLNGEDGQALETDEESSQALNAATESALMRSMRDEDDDGYDRQRSAGSAATRRRGTRQQKPAKRGMNVSTQTDNRRDPTTLYMDKERAEAALFSSFQRQEMTDGSRASREATSYTELLARASALVAAQRLEHHSPQSQQRKMQRSVVAQALEPWTRHLKHEELTEAFLALNPSRAVGSVYLDGGSERQSSGCSRLVSMASTSFEEGESLPDPHLSLNDDHHQEPDALRDLLNCVVSRPLDVGVDWEAECTLTSANVDVSRPTRNPMNPQSRNGHQAPDSSSPKTISNIAN